MNCIIVDDDEMCRNTLVQLAGQVDFLQVKKVCKGPLEALETLKKEKIDLMFLDIEMPEMSGMDMIKSLESRPMVILTTSHTEYALEAFDFNVVDYLVKPVMLPRFMKAVNKARELFDSSRNQISGDDKDFFFIRENSVMQKLLINDILWIEALGDYLTINTADKKYILHMTLKAIETRLPMDKFVRVHRSFIVAVGHISSVEDHTIVIDKKMIPVGAMYRENFMRRLNLL